MLQILFLYLQFTHKETNSKRLNNLSKVIRKGRDMGGSGETLTGDALPKPVYLPLRHFLLATFPPFRGSQINSMTIT